MKNSKKALSAALGMIVVLLLLPTVAWATTGYRFSGSTFYVTGTGDMPDYANSISMPWWQSKNSIKEVVINEGVTSIGGRAFQDCKNLKKVTISKTVTKIGAKAFDGCHNLTEVIYSGSNQGWRNVKGVADSGITCGVKTASTTGSGSYCGSNVYWSISGGTLTITGSGAMYSYMESCSETTGEVVAKTTPWKDRYFSKVVISSGVTNVGAGAFAGKTSINSIEISDTVKDIGVGAFQGCTNLGQLQLPKGLEKISDGAFRGCTGLNSISEKNSAFNLTSIGKYAFSGCTNLRSIDFPNYLINVYDGAFSGCTSLRTVNIRANSLVKTIGDYAFANCTSLPSITLGYYTESIGGYAFYGCTALSEVKFYKSGDISPELGDKELTCQLKHIGSHAFKDCTSLRSFAVPGFVTSIGDYAFSGCTQLSSVTFPASRSGGVIQFGGGYSLIEVKPSALKYLGEGAFEDCGKLSSITLPENLTTVSKLTFYGCTSLTGIEIPEKVTTIGNSAFNASGLVYVTLPESVKCIDDYAFAGCESLLRITFEEPYPRQQNPTQIELGAHAFHNCTSLIGIELPDGVRDIKEMAFYNCTSLMAIGFPDSIETIAKDAFGKCTLSRVCHDRGRDGKDSQDSWKEKRAENWPFYEPYARYQYYFGKDIEYLSFEMENCTSSAAQEYGDVVTITAAAAPAGYKFDHWDVPWAIELADAKASETTFVLPPLIPSIRSAVIKAVYSEVTEPPRNGLVEENGTWYYYVNGVVDTSYTGLAYREDIGWWYVENGRINFDYTGFAYREDIGWWYVENSGITFSYTGLAYDEALGWRYVENSQPSGTYTGLTYREDIGWWYVENGRINFDYTGLAYREDIGWWYVENSGITFTYNGVVTDERGTWNVVNSQVVTF